MSATRANLCSAFDLRCERGASLLSYGKQQQQIRPCGTHTSTSLAKGFIEAVLAATLNLANFTYYVLHDFHSLVFGSLVGEVSGGVSLVLVLALSLRLQAWWVRFPPPVSCFSQPLTLLATYIIFQFALPRESSKLSFVILFGSSELVILIFDPRPWLRARAQRRTASPTMWEPAYLFRNPRNPRL